MSQTTGQAPAPSNRWLARCGSAAFLFFLLKGIAWLVVPAALAFAGISW